MRLLVGSIQFPLASFERPTCIATETTLYTPGHVSLSTAADSRSHDLKSRRCKIVSLENLTRVSGCQEGSMLSSSIAAETHVKVGSDQIKYSLHAFPVHITPHPPPPPTPTHPLAQHGVRRTPDGEGALAGGILCYFANIGLRNSIQLLIRYAMC